MASAHFTPAVRAQLYSELVDNALEAALQAAGHDLALWRMGPAQWFCRPTTIEAVELSAGDDDDSAARAWTAVEPNLAALLESAVFSNSVAFTVRFYFIYNLNQSE